MFKSIGTWMACAAMLSSGLMAQEEAPKANPIEVKEQNGEVLGSLGQTDNKWIPSVNVNAGFQSKFFNRGIMLDRNAHASIDVSLSWMPTENSRLSIGINGNAPTRNSHKFIHVQRTIQGGQTIDDTGKPVEFPYYEDYLGFFGERWNQNVLLAEGNYDDDNYPYIFQKTVPLYDNIITTEKVSYTSLREKNEFDERQIKIEYTYTFTDIPLIGDVSVSGGFTSLRDNDIYSEVTNKSAFTDYSLIMAKRGYEELRSDILPDLSLTFYPKVTNLINELRNMPYTDENGKIITMSSLFKLIGQEYYPSSKYPNLRPLVAEYLGALIYLQAFYESFPDDDPEGTEFFSKLANLLDKWKSLAESITPFGDYTTMYNYKVKTRDQRREELNIGLSLDNVLDSTSIILNPNMSFNFETNGHVWMQYGLNFTMPLEIISNKLTWDTSVDAYWFDHDYFKVSEYSSYYVVDKEGKIDQKRTEELMKINSSYHGTKEVAHSPSGFKTFTARTSLNYAIRPNIIISPNVSAVHRIDILDHKDANNKFFDQNDFVWCGINLNYSF